MKLIISRTALADLERLQVFLSDKNPDAAQRVIETLGRVMQSLDMFPERGRPSGLAGARELVVPFGRSAYVLRYSPRPDADEIIILRIWHGREQR